MNIQAEVMTNFKRDKGTTQVCFSNIRSRNIAIPIYSVSIRFRSSCITKTFASKRHQVFQNNRLMSLLVLSEGNSQGQGQGQGQCKCQGQVQEQ